MTSDPTDSSSNTNASYATTTTTTTNPNPTTPQRAKRPTCLHCSSPAKVKRPKNGHPLCMAHFISIFESEILHTIQSTSLFQRGERIAIGASGGKDSTVLAAVLTTLNDRHDLGLDLHLLSIDEGIVGYRDHSLATVKRNAQQYNLPLTILSYADLYGWTMDQVVSAVGKKSNCTYCGVFRRQALDRGAEILGITHVVTGHNADDMAETVFMNLLRGDLPRLGRCTAITTQSEEGRVRRSKPMKYTYQKEIVLYAHYRNLDYFTTECTYAPEAFRGSARDLVKALERVRASTVLDIVRSGESFARLLRGPARTAGGGTQKGCKSQCESKQVLPLEGDDGEAIGGCGSSTGGRAMGGEMHEREQALRKEYAEEEGSERNGNGTEEGGKNREAPLTTPNYQLADLATEITLPPRKPPKQKSVHVPKPQQQQQQHNTPPGTRRPQTLRSCTRCGYLSSQELCQACVMLDGLNRTRAKLAVQLEIDTDGSPRGGGGGGGGGGDEEGVLGTLGLEKVGIADGV